MMPSKVIGLTGGIGSGKSTVSNFLKMWGYLVLDADEIARNVTKQADVIEQIVCEFGDDVLAKNGQIDRKVLANIVFNDEKALKRLENLIHPAVIKNVEMRIKKAKQDGIEVLFLDAPLLFEAGLDKLCESVWLVTVSPEIQLERIKKRGGIAESEIKKRIAAQMPQHEKAVRSQLILDNDGSLQELERQLQKALNNLKNK